MGHLNFKMTAKKYNIELNLRSNITVVVGNTGTGKTFLYNLIKENKNADNIIYINYNSVKKKDDYNNYVKLLRNIKDSIIIIDDADIIQDIDDSIMYVVNTDYGNNTFIIIGMSPAVTYNISDLAEVKIIDNKIELEYLFPETLM